MMKAVDVSEDERIGVENLEYVLRHGDKYVMFFAMAEHSKHVDAIVVLSKSDQGLAMLSDLLSDVREIMSRPEGPVQ